MGTERQSASRCLSVSSITIIISDALQALLYGRNKNCFFIKAERNKTILVHLQLMKTTEYKMQNKRNEKHSEYTEAKGEHALNRSKKTISPSSLRLRYDRLFSARGGLS
jgi:hypothetical protein